MSIALRRPNRQAKTAIKVPEEAWNLARHSRAIDDMPGVLSASQLASFIDEHADRLSKYEALVRACEAALAKLSSLYSHSGNLSQDAVGTIIRAFVSAGAATTKDLED